MRNFIHLKLIFLQSFKFAGVSKKNLEKKEELESTVSVLQENVHYHRNQANELKCENEEL